MSSISLNKLAKLLDKCNFYINQYFGMKKYCMYIELVSKINGESYIMYIPSKYNVDLSQTSSSYELKEIKDISSSNDIAYEYSDKHKDFEEMYSILTLEEKVNEGVLNNNYKKNIEINDVRSRDNKDVKKIYRQMNRFKYSVENLKYKLAILHNSYLCSVSRDNEVDFYYIKNYPRGTNKSKMVILFDLETLYSKHYIIHTELLEVKTNIEKLLGKNYDINLKYITRLLSNNIKVEQINSTILQKRKVLDMKYDEQKLLFKTTSTKEGIIRDMITKEGKTQKNMIQLKDVLNTKSKIIMGLIESIEARDNFILLCDNVLFDNIIMFDKISKNLNLLNEI